jgi:hypothetical protein
MEVGLKSLCNHKYGSSGRDTVAHGTVCMKVQAKEMDWTP